MRILLLAFLVAFPLLGDDQAVVWPDHELGAAQTDLTKELNAEHYAMRVLGEYGNHSVLMLYREASGPSETHADWTDLYIVQSGSATLLVGGSLTEARRESLGEMLGTSIQGARRVQLEAGDVVNIPAGTAHQIIVEPGAPITYLIVKVKKGN